MDLICGRHKIADRKARVQHNVGYCDLELKSSVDVTLDVKRHFDPVYGAVIRQADFDGDVQAGIVVGMSTVSDGDGEKRRGVEEDVHLTEMLEEICGISTDLRKLSRGAEVEDGLAVASFMADVGGEPVFGRESVCDGEGGNETPIVGEIVQSDGMSGAVRAGPGTGRKGVSCCGGTEFGPRAGGIRKVEAEGAGGGGFEDDGAGFVIGPGDAAGGAGESNVT